MGGGDRRSNGELSVAWEDSVSSHAPDDDADSGIPMQLWNHVVKQHVPGPNPKLGGSMRNRSPMDGSISQPFSRTRTRNYKATSIDSVTKQLEALRPHSVPVGVGRGGNQETPLPLGLQSRTGTSSREAAVLLVQTFEDLQQKIRDSLGGYDPDELAREAAAGGDADPLMEVLEPTIVAVDVVMSELVKQVFFFLFFLYYSHA